MNLPVSHESFRKVVEEETRNLRISIEKWTQIVADIGTTLDEKIVGDINVAVGQAELIIRERFKQFKNLIASSEDNSAEKEITLGDLQGFWDIVSIQVEKIQNAFISLGKQKANDWTEPSKSLAKISKPLPAATKKPSAFATKVLPNVGTKSSIREHILAQRKKLKTKQLVMGKEEKENLPASLVNQNDVKGKSPNGPEEVKEFEGGFFKVLTPVKQRNLSKRKVEDELSVSSPTLALGESKAKYLTPTPKDRLVSARKDYSPCMRVTRSMKKNRQR